MVVGATDDEATDDDDAAAVDEAAAADDELPLFEFEPEEPDPESVLTLLEVPDNWTVNALGPPPVVYVSDG